MISVTLLSFALKIPGSSLTYMPESPSLHALGTPSIIKLGRNGLIIEPIAFQNFAHTSGGSMGSPSMLTALTVHWPWGYWFLPRWPCFLLFWLPKVVVWGSRPELSLSSSSSSIGLGGWRRRLLLPVGATYMDHTIWQVIMRSLWKCILNARF
jgi:hypothetical protein